MGGTQALAWLGWAGLVRRQRRAPDRGPRQLEPVEEAYAQAGGSRLEQLPLFRAAHRMNACNTDLLLEQQGSQGDTP